jgi:uncharacterized protein
MGFGQTVILLLTPVAAFSIASLWIGHVAAGRTPLLTDAAAAVGRMAFTNYLIQSVVMTTIFYTFNQFGHWGYASQIALVLLVWVGLIAFSLVWLSRFRFGPLEWLWRWATYGKRPPLALDTATQA